MRQLRPLGTSILAEAAYPCRSSLAIYQQIDSLNTYIVLVNISTDCCDLIAVPIDCIISKVVTISISENHYCVVQPNNNERH